MILQAVDELLRVLEAHTDGNTFWLQFYSVAVEETVYVSGRVSCGKDYASTVFGAVGSDDAFDSSFLMALITDGSLSVPICG